MRCLCNFVVFGVKWVLVGCLSVHVLLCVVLTFSLRPKCVNLLHEFFSSLLPEATSKYSASAADLGELELHRGCFFLWGTREWSLTSPCGICRIPEVSAAGLGRVQKRPAARWSGIFPTSLRGAVFCLCLAGLSCGAPSRLSRLALWGVLYSWHVV